MVVLVGNLFHLSRLDVFTWCNDIDICRMTHARFGSEKFVAIVGKGYTSVVSPLVGNLFYLTLEVSLVEIESSVPNTDEGKALVVLVPYEAFNIGIELIRNVVLLACGEFINTEAVAVALVSITSHALPCNVLTISRELRVSVIARIVFQVFRSIYSLMLHTLSGIYLRRNITSLLAEVLSLMCTYIV